MRYVIRHDPTRRLLGQTSSIVAPLFAAAGVTAMSVVVQQPESIGRPGIALILLSGAATLPVTSVIASLWAGYYQDEPGGSAVDCSPPPVGVPEADRAVVVYRAYRYWTGVTRRSYSSGLLCSALGLIAFILPHNPSPTRWFAATIVALGIVINFLFRKKAPVPETEEPRWVKSN